MPPSDSRPPYPPSDPPGAWDEPLPKDPVIEAYKKDIDRTLIRENLRLTVTERFQKLQRLQRLAEELRRAGKKAR